MPQRFLRNSTTKVGEALQLAIMETANLRKGLVTAEFILMALVEQKDSVVIRIFNDLGLDAAAIRQEIVDRALAAVQGQPDLPPGQQVAMQISQDVQNLFDAADVQRRRLGDRYISTGSVFLACFDAGVPPTRKLLLEVGLTQEKVASALQNSRGHGKIDQKDAESRPSLLAEYATDMTAQARRGELDPVVGRDDEIRRVIEILSRRKKNNPVLIGEPGVGKTVIVEGLAQAIVDADVPEHLLGRRVLALEMGSLIAGAKMQGEFEDRLKKIIDEVTHAEGEIILFIDELHTVVGAGRSGGGLDASNMLKPVLARGRLQCIGATTLKEYKQFIESDKALERRFQPVRIEQPSVADTVKILTGLKPRYEAHHHIEYADEALMAAAELSDRYLTERFLPDKAIDLMDEAGAVRRLKVVATPPALRALESKRQDLQAKKSDAFDHQDFEKMAHFQMELSRLEDELKSARDQHLKSYGEIERRVGAQDIAAIVARQTGIPATKLAQDEAERLGRLDEILGGRVIGQEAAVRAVANAIRRNRAGLRNPSRPVASFLFLGPTGVGKTELVKAIAGVLMDDDSKIIRLDMSEFMEKHAVSRLIGSPPGYIGYGEGGQLTERVRRQPYSVVLFDEFEKAHPDVYHLLLQVLDEGWLTDSEGTRVSFRNTIIVGTSNLGSEILTERRRPVGIGAQNAEWSRDEEQKAVLDEVRRFLRPEFINRLDEIIVFNRLGANEVERILDLQLNDLRNRLKHAGRTLTIDQAVRALILEGIDTDHYGARPLRRKIEQLIENRIATFLIGGGAPAGASLHIKVAADKRGIEITT